MDIWRSGYIDAPLAEVLARGLEPFEATWLPDPERRHAFHADPFGLVRNNKTYIFIEALDYRDRRGRIDVLTLDRDRTLVDQRTCLREPWHLSYPVPLTWEGKDYLLPEAHRSRRLTLYRAVEFPFRWEAAHVIELPHVPVDATPVHHAGLWWLFYAPAGSGGGELHVAFAERLSGPWHSHPANPVRTGQQGSRPGGTPIGIDGALILPVQDCSRTYGGAVRPLAIEVLTTDRFEASLGEAITPPAAFAPFSDGLHTLSACGDITLFDVKRIDRSWGGRLTGLVGKARRAAGQWRAPNDRILRR